MADIVINLDTNPPTFKPKQYSTTDGKSFTVEVIVPKGSGVPSFPICPQGMSPGLPDKKSGKSTDTFTFTFTVGSPASGGTLEAAVNTPPAISPEGTGERVEGEAGSGSGGGEEKTASGSIEVSSPPGED